MDNIFKTILNHSGFLTDLYPRVFFYNFSFIIEISKGEKFAFLVRCNNLQPCGVESVIYSYLSNQSFLVIFFLIFGRHKIFQIYGSTKLTLMPLLPMLCICENLGWAWHGRSYEITTIFHWESVLCVICPPQRHLTICTRHVRRCMNNSPSPNVHTSRLILADIPTFYWNWVCHICHHFQQR